MDVLVRVLGFEKQELRHHQVGHVVFHRTDQEYEALFQETRIDIERALPATRSLNYHRH